MVLLAKTGGPWTGFEVPDLGGMISQSVSEAWKEVIEWSAAHPHYYAIPLGILGAAALAVRVGDAYGATIGAALAEETLKEVI